MTAFAYARLSSDFFIIYFFIVLGFEVGEFQLTGLIGRSKREHFPPSAVTGRRSSRMNLVRFAA